MQLQTSARLPPVILDKDNPALKGVSEISKKNSPFKNIL